MKTFVLTVSKQFPKTHNRAGQDTRFVYNIQKLFSNECEKIHTIRANYELWAKRAKEINEGSAILSIRYWSEKPYRSKQVEICRLEKIGVEKLEDPTNFVFAPIEGKKVDWELVAKNDGLSFVDFCEWFKIRNKEPMAIIHFTDFRYCQDDALSRWKFFFEGEEDGWTFEIDAKDHIEAFDKAYENHGPQVESMYCKEVHLKIN